MVQSRSSLLLLNDGFLALSKRSAAFQHSSKLVVVNQTAQNSRPLLSIKGRPKYYGSSSISRSQLLVVDFSSPVPNVDFSNFESNVDLNKSRTLRRDFSIGIKGSQELNIKFSSSGCDPLFLRSCTVYDSKTIVPAE